VLHLKLRPSPATARAIAAHKAAAARTSAPAAPVAPPTPAPAARLSPAAWFDQVIARLEALRQKYPATFRRSCDLRPWPPLTVGTHRELRRHDPELGRPWPLVHAALQRYTTDHRYAVGHTEGATRIGFDGEPNGVVTAEQAAKGPCRRRSPPRVG
jgi:ProP effector